MKNDLYVAIVLLLILGTVGLLVASVSKYRYPRIQTAGECVAIVSTVLFVATLILVVFFP